MPRQIKQQIENIIDYRKRTRLPKIEQQIAFLKDVLSKVEKLDSVIATVRYQIEQKNGPYYTMLLADPTMEARFNIVSTTGIKEKLKKQIELLELLKRRFSRDAVQVAFVGYERQGKSRFLQSISGLSNNVIPAYSGTSCTGAVSVIHNVGSGFSATIKFYTLAEFLGIMKDKLKKFFPGRTFTLNSIQDLKYLDLSGFNAGTNISLSTEFEKFCNGYVAHADDFAELIGHSDLITTDEKQIIQHVAQYEEFGQIPQCEDASQFTAKEKDDDNCRKITVYVKYYYKYLAVKSATIYTSFPAIDDAKIVLVDTIGMGDSTDAQRIEDEMFRVLREDCDAAIDVFKPDANGGGFNQAQADILTKIGNELCDRDPQRWIYYAINRVEHGKGRNTENIPAIIKAAKDSFKNLASVPVADVVDVNAADKDEVNEKLLGPLLDMITENLDDIDSKLMANANTTSGHLYQEYKMFADAVASVISGQMKQGSNELKKFRQLLQNDLDYSNELKKLDNKYADGKDRECPQVKNEIERVIAGLTMLVSNITDICTDVEKGKGSTNEIFEKYVKLLRNRIYDAFADVNTGVLIPLQEDVKNSLINILFNNAKFGNIPLQGYAIEDGASKEWLATFIREKVDRDVYPKMNAMLHFILDYQLNIQGLIEYDVAKCLGTIDKHSAEFRTMNPVTGVNDMQHAKKIFSEIVNRTTVIQTKMRSWRDEFSLIPSHSFYARISMFRDMMVDDADTNEELYNFYSENRMTVWRDEFASLAEEASAFGEWNKASLDITQMCIKNNFHLKLN